jgi:TM2 domain-containing membrane protein YozV
MKNEEWKIVFFALVFLTGKFQAQSLSIEMQEDSENSRVPTQISTLEPIQIDSSFLIFHSSLKEKDPVIAWLISFPGGMLGLHRVYLGTSTKTVLLYIFTVGGVFGIVPMIDWILLLQGIQNGDISKYIGNRKFIMWL